MVARVRIGTLRGSEQADAETHGAVVRRVDGAGSEFGPESEHGLVDARALVPRARLAAQHEFVRIRQISDRVEHVGLEL